MSKTSTAGGTFPWQTLPDELITPIEDAAKDLNRPLPCWPMASSCSDAASSTTGPAAFLPPASRSPTRYWRFAAVRATSPT